MDVRGFILDGLQHHEVQQPLDAVVVGLGDEVFEVDRLAAIIEVGHRDVFGQISDEGGERLIVFTVEPIDHLVDLNRGGDHRIHLEAHQQTQVIQSPEVVGRLEGHRQRIRRRIVRNREDVIRIGHLGGDHPDDTFLEVVFLQIDGSHPRLSGESHVDVIVGAITQLDQKLADRSPLFLLKFQTFLSLITGDLAHFGQHTSEATAGEFGIGAVVFGHQGLSSVD